MGQSGRMTHHSPSRLYSRPKAFTAKKCGKLILRDDVMFVSKDEEAICTRCYSNVTSADKDKRQKFRSMSQPLVDMKQESVKDTSAQRLLDKTMGLGVAAVVQAKDFKKVFYTNRRGDGGRRKSVDDGENNEE